MIVNIFTFQFRQVVIEIVALLRSILNIYPQPIYMVAICEAGSIFSEDRKKSHVVPMANKYKTVVARKSGLKPYRTCTRPER